MSKIIKAKYKISRRWGESIWGNGKDAFHNKNYRPGQHGRSTRPKLSDYGGHLRTKQILKGHYGYITEKQFKNTFLTASKMRGNTAENFIKLLERRLDMVVYRLNFAPTIFAARQLVSHGHILVNGKKVDIPSYRLKDESQIELSAKARNMPLCIEALQKKERNVPTNMTLDEKKMSGVFVTSTSTPPYPFDISIGKVVEYYSK